MRLLLDTHIWVWSMVEPRRLSPRIHRELHDPGNERWISPISVWEALLLHAKGRIQIAADVREWTESAIANFHEAPLTHEIAMAAHNLGLAGRDPADRFLAATAEVLGLTLVTADAKLLGLGNIATLANR
jgi:PIN domain nuclease of toxin-antitoxin system